MLNLAKIKTWYLVHKWTSLICTVFLLMLCITGLPLIFGHEIHDWLDDHPEPAQMPANTPRISLDTIVADAKARRPMDAMQFVFTDHDEPNIWGVGLGETADAPESSVFYTYDARTGALLDTWTREEDTLDFMDVMFRLHYDMFAGLPGTLFLGFMGLLLAASLVSGAVVYGPFMRKLSFGTVRKDKSARTKWLDLHNLLGIATLIWVLVVGVTGVINTLAIPIFGYWKSTDLAAMVAPYRDQPPLADPGSIQRAHQAAIAAAPGMTLDWISFPGNDFASPHHYAAYFHGDTPLTSKLLKPVLIDAQTYQVTDTRDLPWYVTALLVSQPLHFGDYGGLPLKILWALLDILAIVVLGSGVYLWMKKRKVPIEERLHGLLNGAPTEPDYEAAMAMSRHKHTA